VTAAPVAQPLRAGAGFWLEGAGSMLRWHLTGLRLLLPVVVAVQLLMGIGFVFAIGLFAPELPPRSAFFAVTGPAVVTLLNVGLILGPQLIAQQRIDGTYDYVRALPVPRSAAAAAWYGVTVVVGLPAAAATLAVGAVHYDVGLVLSWRLLPALLLTTYTGAMIGYATAHAVAEPRVTIFVSQLLIFVLLGFAPVNFPPEQMPGWLAELNRAFPFLPMGTVVRDALDEGFTSSLLESYVVLTAWAGAATALAVVLLGRRR
jgi:ABC-2 type transport system permease protein